MDVSIKIIGKKFRCSLELNHCITVIIGDSGVGKSCFIQALLDNSGAYKKEISEDLVPLRLERYVVDCLDTGYLKKRLCVVDDKDFLLVPEVISKIKAVRDCMFIFVTRNLAVLDAYAIPKDAVYKFKADGLDHWIEPLSLSEEQKLFKEARSTNLAERGKAALGIE